jgi:hypothetical protein
MQPRRSRESLASEPSWTMKYDGEVEAFLSTVARRSPATFHSLPRRRRYFFVRLVGRLSVGLATSSNGTMGFPRACANIHGNRFLSWRPFLES